MIHLRRREFVAFILITLAIVSTKSQSLDCNGYTDNSGLFNQPQSCSMLGMFCCGSCNTSRYCCSNALYALNQTFCPTSISSQVTSTSSYSQNTISYPYIITVDNTLYWIKICMIVIPIFIFIALLGFVLILCAKARKAKRKEPQIVYSFHPQVRRIPTPVSGTRIYTIPSSLSTLNDAPRYETIQEISPNGAFLVQTEELPKYDDL